MVSTARHKYGGRWLKVGDHFDAEEAHASELESPSIAFARRLNAKERKEEEATAAAKKKQEEDEARRTYKRRDMKSE